jgi:succinyl-diaminopimelate desuccinylase
MIRKERLKTLVQSLIRINSENPPGDEAAIAAYVADYLRKIGLEPKLHAFSSRRDNVLVVLKGLKPTSPLLITPHLDTVPAGRGWRVGPFSGALRQGKIYGRGATDCKGNLAAGLEALSSLCEEGVRLENDLIFLATADEETGSHKGLLPFLEERIIRPAFALVLDSEGYDIITTQKGLIHFKVQVKGRKAHGAYPHLGLNAIDEACRLKDALKKMAFLRRKHRRLRSPTVNIGTIQGGDVVNMVADWCEFEADLRFLPGMKPKELLSDIKRTFDRCGVSYRLKVDNLQEAYEIDDSHILVRSLKEAACGVTRLSRIRGSEGATVITFFRKHKIPAVATGYGQRGAAHTSNEYVRFKDLYQGARILERFIKIFDHNNE